MLYTSNPLGTPPLNPTSKQTGRQEDNALRAIKVNNHSNKDLARPLLTLPPLQGHGIINQSQWTLIKQGHQEGTGEDEGEVHKGGM